MKFSSDFSRNILGNFVVEEISLQLLAKLHLEFLVDILPEVSTGVPSHIFFFQSFLRKWMPSEFFQEFFPKFLLFFRGTIRHASMFSSGITTKINSEFSSSIPFKTHPRNIFWHYSRNSSKKFPSDSSSSSFLFLRTAS